GGRRPGSGAQRDEDGGWDGRSAPGRRSPAPRRGRDGAGRGEGPGAPGRGRSGPGPRREPGSRRGYRDSRGTPRRTRLTVPEGISAEQLDPQARAELRTLPGDLADAVAAWLVAAAAEPDPDRAVEFAVQARKLAARVGVVRETAGVAAYRAGRWADALAELRTARRLTGRARYLPPI